MRIVVPTVAAALVPLLAAAAAPAPVTASERQVPAGWLGVTADGPLGAAAGGEWDLMATSGVESVRTAVRWNELQPYASAAAVPTQDAARFRDVGGVPTDFTGLDALVAVAAQRGLAVLPVLQSTAGWAARRTGDTTSPPRDPAAFARFLARSSTATGRAARSGTSEGTVVDAPALAVFSRWARKLEGCTKSADARRCS